VALAGSLLVNSVFTFGLAFVIFSLCLGTLDIFMNAEAGVVEHDLKKPVFSSFHAAVLYAIGLGGLAGGYVSVSYGAVWSSLLALPFVGLAMLAVQVAIPHRIESVDDKPAAAALPRKALILIGVVIGLDVAAELTCIQWSGQMLAEMQPTLAQFSGLGVAFYGLCNGTVRLFGDTLRARFNDITLIIVSLCVGVAGFAVLATEPGFAVSIAAFAVAGSGLGLIFPCLFSVAGRLAPESRAAALSLASAVSGPPRIFLPILLGVVAQGYGLSAIYGAAGSACAIAIGFTILVGREMRRPPSPLRGTPPTSWGR
jgi:fucose permease